MTVLKSVVDLFFFFSKVRIPVRKSSVNLEDDNFIWFFFVIFAFLIKFLFWKT